VRPRRDHRARRAFARGHARSPHRLSAAIDYLRPATPKRDLYARAEVYKLTRHVAFLRAEAYEDDPRDLVAAATGTFMFVRRNAARKGLAKP
jgi:acyl-coenzyme A thioesterase PaaI-like protein